ncbi:MAG TPA: hypothetical protein VEX18_03515, partial [Polyangiaceae bacterium]|nr:hypothetical protein [Polyangiaceae bacterium]
AAHLLAAWAFLAVLAAGVGLRRAELGVVAETPHPEVAEKTEPGSDGTRLADGRRMSTPNVSRNRTSKPKQASQQAASKKASKSPPPGVPTPSGSQRERAEDSTGNGQLRKGSKGTGGRRSS